MWGFVKDFIIYGFSSILGKLIAVLLLPIYTSILTREEYGAMTLILSCYGIIDLLANLNIHSGIARDYYELGVDRKKLVSTGFFSILTISVSLMIILLWTRYFWFTSILSLDNRFILPFTIMLCGIPVSSLHTYFSVLTRYKKKPILYSLGTLLQLVVSLSLSVYGVVFMKYGISSIFIATLLGNLLSTLFFVYLNNDLLFWGYDRSYLIKALKFSIPTLPAVLAGWIDNSVGQIFIGKYISLSTLGVYSIAVSVSSVFSLITVAFMNVWSPFLYENFRLPDFGIKVYKIFSILVLGLIAISSLLSLFSKEIILILTNPSYLDACKYITIICIPMCIYLLFPIASSGVSLSRETKYIGFSYIIGSIINICLLLLILPRVGAVAIPISLAASRIFTYFYLYNKSKSVKDFHLPNHWLVFFIFLMTSLYFVITLNLLFIIRLLIASVLLILLLYRANKIIDIFELKNVIKKVKG